MKFLVLVTIITWSFYSSHPGFPNSPSYKIVSSPNEAALAVYHDRPRPFQVEPDHKKYELWEIDIKKKTFKQLEIPEVVFKDPEKDEYNLQDGTGTLRDDSLKMLDKTGETDIPEGWQ